MVRNLDAQHRVQCRKLQSLEVLSGTGTSMISFATKHLTRGIILTWCIPFRRRLDNLAAGRPLATRPHSIGGRISAARSVVHSPFLGFTTQKRTRLSFSTRKNFAWRKLRQSTTRPFPD